MQELVKLHGGSITAESVLGQGTTFAVTLPLGPAHLPPDQIVAPRATTSNVASATPYVEEALRWLPEPPSPASLEFSGHSDGRPHVLLADDNADMRHYLVRLLAERYAVKATADGAAALAAARERPPDLVLTDVMMPQLDGFGLLRELRADPRTHFVPVIMLSARSGEESRVEGMEAGADDYLIKPFSARELMARVETHLQLARFRRESAAALRASEERLQMALDSSSMGTFLWHVGEDRGEPDARMLALFGLTAGSPLTLADALDRLIHPADRERYGAAVARAIDPAGTGELREEIRVVHPGGDERWLTIFGRTEFTGEPRRAVRMAGMTMDVTDRKRAEEAVREADRRKDEFLAMLAHELRGPLAPLRNMVEIMKRASGNEALIQQARDTMERQLRQMVRLVDDLLDVSRVTHNRLELRTETVALATVVHQAVETNRPLAESARLEVLVTLPPGPIYLQADPVRLAQVFGNLLANACKYTEPGGRIELTAERDGDDVLVKVKDSGIGIPADKLTSIFEMFMQVDRSLERAQGGLGIGLTLVKRLVEMHGGTVEAQSEGPGRGSELVVRLPTSSEEDQAPLPTAPSVEERTSVRRILIVDDNQDSAASLAMLLAITGNETHTAHDGLEAVAAAERFRPQAILLDLGLPKLNGFDAARRIREQPWGQKMVLVALTGWGQEEDRRKSKEAGFDLHMVKPVDFHALLKFLDEKQPTPA